MKELLKKIIIKQSQIKVGIKRLTYLQQVTKINYKHEIDTLLDQLNTYKKLEDKLRDL